MSHTADGYGSPAPAPQPSQWSYPTQRRPRAKVGGFGLALPIDQQSQYRHDSYQNSSGEDLPSPCIPLKKVDHGRSRKRNPSNDPKSFYKPPPPSASWGRRDKKGQHLFEYNPKHVELDMYKRYSKDELRQFFQGDGAPGNRPPNRSFLTLWIQNPPAQVNQRYHSGSASSKCRWKHCPDPKNTILKGFWRVAFDESSDRTGFELDPFLNAGYMHLYCLESAFDLIELIYVGESSGTFLVHPDIREFGKETRNPMAMTRDHREMLRVFKNWKTTQLAKHNAHCEAYQRAYPGVASPVASTTRMIACGAR